jgi:hypothetical protein
VYLLLPRQVIDGFVDTVVFFFYRRSLVLMDQSNVFLQAWCTTLSPSSRTDGFQKTFLLFHRCSGHILLNFSLLNQFLELFQVVEEENRQGAKTLFVL